MADPLIHAYNPEWAEWFAQLQKMLSDGLGDSAIAIEHVGSTSVPGLAAKAIIDIDVVIEPERFAEVRTKLGSLGYAHNGDQGIPTREAFKLVDPQAKATRPPHHLYVCPKGSPELARHLYFRERMKARSDERDQYAAKKRLMAELCDQDRKLYAAVKEVALKPWFDSILSGMPGHGGLAPDPRISTYVPESAMIITAHPDDAEFTMAGTAAAWAKAGCRVVYVICTDGNAGSHEADMTAERLAKIRRAEQTAACQQLGVAEVVFLGRDDARLEATLDLRRELVRQIRAHKPEVVLGNDPTSFFSGHGYINHPDHRAAALATMDAVAPACELRLLWPDAGPPHRVKQVWVRGNGEPDIWVDISDVIGAKIAALKEHKSQMGEWDPSEMIREWNGSVGQEVGVAYAENYRVMVLHE
jgi:LmbE family N-acetylglucosaminyl deacetylase/GrpB-like predicted nucleotidyltransferase (UPF0157 family)